MFTALCLALTQSATTPASTWATAGVVHEQIAAADVNGDGFADIVIAFPTGGLLVSESVRGWKAAPWRPLDANAFPGGLEAFTRAAAEVQSVATPPSPPPYEPGAKLARCVRGDLDGDGDLDVIAVYRCTRPGDFLELRVTFTPGPDANDRDGDGLSDEEEKKLGTDPLDRDSDADGLLDGWEVHGFPRGIALGDKVALNPLQQDVVVAVAPYEGLDRAKVESELARAAQLYHALATKNRDGSSGINVHGRIDASVSPADQCGGDWGQCGAKRFALNERGFLHWMQVTPWGGGQSQQTGDMGGCGQGFAVFAHEFGHQLSLSHEGDSPAAWCPLYPSLMNYAFGYSIGGDANAVHFSSGEFRATSLDEHALAEHLPYAFERVKYLAAGPFRFTLEDDHAGGTRIDWNHNGRFDDTPVSADINYGASTYCGARRDLGGLTIGAAPALAYVGDKCWLATLDTTQAVVSVRGCEGNEKWGEPRALPSTATNEDPLLVGAWDQGWAFTRRATGWLVSRFDDKQVLEPAEVAGLPNLDLSVARVGEYMLFVTRASDDTLTAYWLLGNERIELTGKQPLALKSSVPVGVGVDPKDGRVVIASAQTNSGGKALCLRVTWFEVQETTLVERETRWVRGEKSGTNCTTRPVVAFDADGQLNIFHTGMPQADGQMTAWRTRRVGNEKLDEGWLTCLLYDVWTRTRRGVAFANGAQGALYAFRWDAAVANGMQVNELLVAHNGFGIDPEPMRDFDDGEKMSKHGLVHSILWMQQVEK